MKIYNICLKTLVLFYVFNTGVTTNDPLLSKNICKQINNNKYIPFKKKIIYYGCSGSDSIESLLSKDIHVCSGRLVKTVSRKRIRRLNNPYVVFAKDILRKYVYIFNVVVIYVLLNI
jgi:hypothetical protein